MQSYQANCSVMRILTKFKSLFTNFFWPSTIKKMAGTVCVNCNGRHVRKNCNNHILIGKKSYVANTTFLMHGRNNIVEIGDGCSLNGVSFWISGDNNRIIIGSKTTVGQRTEFAALEGTSIIVGEDCMFSHDIRVRTSDSHSILNENGERINPASDICIGNHVWVGMKNNLLKGTSIADNCVVGAGSILGKAYPEGCLIAGIPAKVLKEKINWSREKL